MQLNNGKPVTDLSSWGLQLPALVLGAKHTQRDSACLKKHM